jgi:hypothetical protein
MKLVNWAAASVALGIVSGACAIQPFDEPASERNLVATSDQALEVEPDSAPLLDAKLVSPCPPDTPAHTPCVYQTSTHGPLWGSYSNADNTCRVGSRAFAAGHFACEVLHMVAPTDRDSGERPIEPDLPPEDPTPPVDVEDPPQSGASPCVPSQGADQPVASPCYKEIPSGDLE